MKSVSLLSPDERFAFRIPGYGLDHQGGAIVDIGVEVDFKEDVGVVDPFAYPEFVSVVNFIKNYLVTYPNEGDFWEVLNRNLVTALLTQTIPTTFGVEYNLDKVVDSLSVDIAVESGSSNVDFNRASSVTAAPEAGGLVFEEGFSFEISDYGLDHQGGAIVDIEVGLDFKEDVAVGNPFAYPEFVSIVNFIKNYLVAYPNEGDFWEVLNRNLVTALLTQTIPTTFGVEYNLDEVVDSLSVDIAVESGSSLVDFNRSSSVTGAPGAGGLVFEEGFSFKISDYGLDHQGGAIVDIEVDLDFKEDVAVGNPFAYPEFVSIVNFIKDYLVTYSNETDFWEILNKNLVTALLSETIPTTFGVEYNLDELVDSLTVEIQVESGSSLVNFNRASQVTGSLEQTGIDFDESFCFEISDYGLDHQGGAVVDIVIDLHFKEGIGVVNPFDYPEFVSIVNFVKDYLVAYPNETDFWEILNKNLAAALLTQTIPTTFGVEYHLADVVDTVTVDIQVQSGSSLVNFPRASSVSQSVEIGAELIAVGDGIFTLAAPAADEAILRIKPSPSRAQTVNDLAVFAVDDAQGRIDGLDQGAAGYVQAALARARNALSFLDDRPDGLDLASLSRSLPSPNGERFGFLLTPNDSLDAVRQRNDANPAVLLGTPDQLTIAATGRGTYTLTWNNGSVSGEEAEELVFQIEAVATPQPLGTTVQGQPEAELIDLREFSSETIVEASFEVYREAAFDNYVGFFAIQDLQGTIADSLTGRLLRPGDTGYLETAVRNRIAGLDLRVENRSTTTVDVTLQGGGLLAPFLVVDGAPEWLDDETTGNDPVVYVPFLAANADGVDHVRLLGDNTFGFEDLAGGGDLDCNDIIVRASLSVA